MPVMLCAEADRAANVYTRLKLDEISKYRARDEKKRNHGRSCRCPRTCTSHKTSGSPYYRLEVLRFTPSQHDVRKIQDRRAGRQFSPQQMWKTLRRNCLGAKGKKLFGNVSSSGKEMTSCLSGGKKDLPSMQRHLSSSKLIRLRGGEVSLDGSPQREVFYDSAVLIICQSSRPVSYSVHRDFCNSQSSPENTRTSSINFHISPKHKPSKRHKKNTKETGDKKMPKRHSSPDIFSGQSQATESIKELSPDVIVNHKRMPTKSCSVSTKTATNDPMLACFNYSSDTVAIAVVTSPAGKRAKDKADVDMPPKTKKFSEEAVKMLGITKDIMAALPANTEENDTIFTSSSRKSFHSLGEDSDTKLSVSSFTASQLNVARRSSLATTATQELSPKHDEFLPENTESASSSESHSSFGSRKEAVEPPEDSRSDMIATVSNIVTKLSDLSGKLNSVTFSSSNLKRCARHSSSSALHKHSVVKNLKGSRKYRRPADSEVEKESLQQTSPHRKAVRSSSCPMNPVSTPEYIEATRHGVAGSSSSFLKVLKGDRSWYPNVVTWFQKLFNRVELRDEICQSPIQHSSPSSMIDKMLPTGKRSTTLKTNKQTHPAETCSHCLICPDEDVGPCPFKTKEHGECDCEDIHRQPKVTKSKPIFSKKPRRIYAEKRKNGRCSKQSDKERYVAISEADEDDEDNMSTQSSPPHKPCTWEALPQKSQSQQVTKKSKSKFELPNCIWEEPEPQTPENENVDIGLVPIAAEEENIWGEQLDDTVSIASLDIEGIGDVDDRRPIKVSDQSPFQGFLNMSILSPSLANYAITAAGNTIWSQLEKIKEASTKFQFPQRKGLYEPPKAYPIWLYPEHIKKVMGMFSKEKNAESQTASAAVKQQVTETVEDDWSGKDDNAEKAADARQVKEKESIRNSGSSWVTSAPAPPKPEELTRIPQAVENYRELRWCYPELPLPFCRYRHPCHYHEHHHIYPHHPDCVCCYPSVQPTHLCQNSATCTYCPLHGASFRSRSSPPKSPCHDEGHKGLPYICSPVPYCVSRCQRYHRKKRTAPKLSSCPVNPRTSLWASCCKKVLNSLHCDAFAESELKRKSCLLSDKGDRYYYKHLFKKKLNMQNFLKELRKVSTGPAPPQNEEGKEKEDSPSSPRVKNLEYKEMECDDMQHTTSSPKNDYMMNMYDKGDAPCVDSTSNPGFDPCNFNPVPLPDAKIEVTKNKSENNEAITLSDARDDLFSNQFFQTRSLDFNRSRDVDSYNLNRFPQKKSSPRSEPPFKLEIKSHVSTGDSCQPKDNNVDEEFFKCPCGLSFAPNCNIQCELVFSRKKSRLMSKIKNGSIEPTVKVVPCAGSYNYNDLHPLQLQIKQDKSKPKDSFRHSSFLFEDVLRDKFIPYKSCQLDVSNPKWLPKKNFLFKKCLVLKKPEQKNREATLGVSGKTPIYNESGGVRWREASHGRSSLKNNLLTASLSRGSKENLNSSSSSYIHQLRDASTASSIYRDGCGGGNVKADAMRLSSKTTSSQILSFQHDYINAQTSTILYGSTNYANLLSTNPNWVFTPSLMKSSSRCTSTAVKCTSNISFSHMSSSRMPFPYNNAEKVIAAPYAEYRRKHY